MKKFAIAVVLNGLMGALLGASLRFLIKDFALMCIMCENSH